MGGERSVSRVGSLVLVVCILAFSCLAIAIAVKPTTCHAIDMPKLLNVSGVFITSISLLVGAYFVLLAIRAYANISDIHSLHREVLDIKGKIVSIHDEADRSIAEIKSIKAAAVESIITFQEQVSLITTKHWDNQYLVAHKSLMATEKFIESARRSDIMDNALCQRLVSELNDARNVVSESRARMYLRCCYDRGDVESQLQALIGMKENNLLRVDHDLQEDINICRNRFSDDENIISMCSILGDCVE